MDSILNKVLFLLIMRFVKMQENNLKCVANEVYDFDNKKEIMVSSEDFKDLDQILKKHENYTIDLILRRLNLPNLKDVKINNYYINKLDFTGNYIKSIPEDFFSRLKFIREINLYFNSNSDLTNLLEKRVKALIF